jgi:gamma-glutamylcysteine synthetase
VTGGGAISLEPGGQFELSGAQVETVHQTSSELMAHLAQVREVAEAAAHRLSRHWHDAELDAPKCRKCQRAATRS